MCHAETRRLNCAWHRHFPSSLQSDTRLVTQNGSISFFGDVELLSSACHPLLGASSSKDCCGEHMCSHSSAALGIRGCSWQESWRRGRTDGEYMTCILGGKIPCCSPDLRAISEKGTDSEGFLLMCPKAGTNHTSNTPFCPPQKSSS